MPRPTAVTGQAKWRLFAHVIVLVSLAGGFLAGRMYERRYWLIAGPAKRETWKAKEGPPVQRLRHAENAIRMDPEYLPAYYFAARALEEDESNERLQAARTMSMAYEGLRRSGAVSLIDLLSYLEKDAGHETEARLLRETAHLIDPDY
jgi:hypothetical protein